MSAIAANYCNGIVKSIASKHVTAAFGTVSLFCMIIAKAITLATQSIALGGTTFR